uniref:Uncharacterized protein n=1 Tax=Rousettus aegyptiacus TaxID=9407 RepID=A0A7J8B9Q8_ROUAE|nr:hypothetical protein HJG63_009949 [Rousettus aegyptiacus]
MSGSESSRAAGQGRDVRALRAVTAQRPGARACLLSHKPALKSASWTEGKGGAPASRGPASRACKSGLLPAAQSPSQSPPPTPLHPALCPRGVQEPRRLASGTRTFKKTMPALRICERPREGTHR